MFKWALFINSGKEAVVHSAPSQLHACYSDYLFI